MSDSTIFNHSQTVHDEMTTTQLHSKSNDLTACMEAFSDSNVIDEISFYLFQFKMTKEHFSGSFNIIYTCSSLGSAYAYIVPQLLYQYTNLGMIDPNFQVFRGVTANIVHAIPRYKTLQTEIEEVNTGYSRTKKNIFKKKEASGDNMSNMQEKFVQNSHTHHQRFFYDRNYNEGSGGRSNLTRVNTVGSNHHFNGSYYVNESGTSFSISPRNSTFSPFHHQSSSDENVWKNIYVNYTYSPGNSDTPIADIDLSHKSSFSPVETPPFIHDSKNHFDENFPSSETKFPDSSKRNFNLSSAEIPFDIENRIFNTFAFMPKTTHSLVVPPNYAHYNFALYPLPTHVLPSFSEIVKARFLETMPTGLMVICYPTSLELYFQCILPCLDLALHQMLALNLISTRACEAITVSPSAECCSYETQKRIINELPQAQIVYSREIIDYKASDCGYRWMSENMSWIRETLSSMGVPSQSILKFMNMLTKNPQWAMPCNSKISLFIVRKKPT